LSNPRSHERRIARAQPLVVSDRRATTYNPSVDRTH
jgi:hypothetical protein